MIEAIGVLAVFAATVAVGIAAERLYKTSSLAERFAFAVLVGMVVFTQSTSFLSSIFGYGRELVALLAIAAAIAFAIVLKNNPVSKKEFVLLKKEFLEHKKAYFFAVVVFLLVGGTLYASTLKQTSEGLVAGGWNWSDFLVHYSIVKSVNNGNYPAQTPFYAGEPLQYDWFVDFHAAIASVAGGEALAMFLQSALLAACLALLTYQLAFTIARNKNAALLAAVIVVLGGGIGYVRLLPLLEGNGFAELVATTSFDNNWDANGAPFRIPSVMSTGLLAHRATTFGLPFFVLAIILLLTARDNKKFFAAGALVALATPFRYFAFASILAFAALFFAKKLLEEKSKKEILDNALAFGVPAAAGFLFLPRANNFAFNWGWEAPTSSPQEFVLFYAANFGVPLLLAVAACLLVKIEKKLLLAATALALFAVPNVVSFTRVAWDMNKFFQFMWVPLAVLAGIALSKLPKAVAAALVALCIISPLLVMAWFASSHLVVLSNQDVEAAAWIEGNTPQKTVFATSAFINSPVDYAGRLRIIGFPLYAQNFGFGTRERENDLEKIYCGSELEAGAAMRKYGATHIIHDTGKNCEHAYENSEFFEKVFDDGTKIYQLRPVT